MTYTAICDRGDGWWAIRVREIPGIFTQARRLDQVEGAVRDAIALMLEIPPDSYDIDVRPVLPAQVDDAMRFLESVREQTAGAHRLLTITSAATAKALVGSGLTVRDAGRIMGLSYQRVGQLLHQTENGPEEGAFGLRESNDVGISAQQMAEITEMTKRVLRSVRANLEDRSNSTGGPSSLRRNDESHRTPTAPD